MTQAWLKHALIGVDAAAPPRMDGALGDLLDRVPHEDAAVQFGRAIGAHAACRRAAVILDIQDLPPPAPAPDDARALPSDHAWTRALAKTFDDAPERVQFEALRRVTQIGATLPAALLPAALQAGQRNTLLRTALMPALGERGIWLAQLNPDWRYAAGSASQDVAADEDRLWQEGSFAQRLPLLRQIRLRDAAKARAMLQAQLGEMPAKERLEFVGVLDEGLGADDAPLLEGLLKDRARDVRQKASSLLALLPDSAHAQRLVSWMSPLVTGKRGLLGTTWRVEAPAEADPGWAAAGVEATRPQYDQLGERAWWLYQLARLVPLAWWTAHTGMKPKDLVAWAGKSDWKGALHRGWYERVRRDDTEWLDAMLESRDGIFKGGRAALLTHLTPAQRERHWPRTLDELIKTGALADVCGSFAVGQQLSTDFSHVLIAGLPDVFASGRLRLEYGVRALLVDLVATVHPDALRDWRPLPRRDDETPGEDECAQSIERIVALRRLFSTRP